MANCFNFRISLQIRLFLHFPHTICHSIIGRHRKKLSERTRVILVVDQSQLWAQLSSCVPSQPVLLHYSRRIWFGFRPSKWESFNWLNDVWIHWLFTFQLSKGEEKKASSSTSSAKANYKTRSHFSVEWTEKKWNLLFCWDSYSFSLRETIKVNYKIIYTWNKISILCDCVFILFYFTFFSLSVRSAHTRTFEPQPTANLSGGLMKNYYSFWLR